jgi:hypothetical protein
MYITNIDILLYTTSTVLQYDMIPGKTEVNLKQCLKSSCISVDEQNTYYNMCATYLTCLIMLRYVTI